MKTFIVEINYLKPFESFGEAVTRHRAYLQQGYDRGLFLFSGPREDKRGGIVIARAVEEEELKIFFDQDPYKLEKLAEHSFTAFSAAKVAPIVEEWVKG